MSSYSNCMAFFRVRGLPVSWTTPSLMLITGLIDNMDPSIALAPPILPPFFRFSNVFNAAKTWVRSMSERTRAKMTSDVGGLPGSSSGLQDEGSESAGYGPAVNHVNRDLLRHST